MGNILEQLVEQVSTQLCINVITARQYMKEKLAL